MLKLISWKRDEKPTFIGDSEWKITTSHSDDGDRWTIALRLRCVSLDMVSVTASAHSRPPHPTMAHDILNKSKTFEFERYKIKWSRKKIEMPTSDARLRATHATVYVSDGQTTEKEIELNWNWVLVFSTTPCPDIFVRNSCCGSKSTLR